MEQVEGVKMSNDYHLSTTALKTAVPAIVVIGVAEFIETVSGGKITTEQAYWISTGIFSAIAGLTNLVKNIWRKNKK